MPLMHMNSAPQNWLRSFKKLDTFKSASSQKELELENENETTEQDYVNSTERTLSDDALIERIQGNSKFSKEVLITHLEEG